MNAKSKVMPTFWTYPLVVSLVLMRSATETLSASHPSESLVDIVYDTTTATHDWTGCCDTDMKGPLKVPGVDFLSYLVTDCDIPKEGRLNKSETTLFSRPLSWMPRLSSIEMCSNMEDNRNMNFVLSLSLEDIVQGRLTDVQVTFGVKSKVGGNERYFTPVCQQYSFVLNQSLLQMATDVKEVAIPNSCLVRDVDEGQFAMTIRPSPPEPWLRHLDSIRYHLSWHYFYDYNSEEAIWDELLVGVAPNPASKEIFVVFQPPKNEYLLDGLRLELYRPNYSPFTEEPVNSSVIPPSQSSFIFCHVTPGRYWVKVTPLGTICGKKDVCETINSQEVLMSEVFLPQVLMPEVHMPETSPTENPPRSEGTGIAIEMVVVAVVVILLLTAVIFAVIIWFANRRRRKGHIPTLHLISPTLSQLEEKAVQYLAVALSNSLGISVTLSHDDQSNKDQYVLTIHPDSDSADYEENGEKSPCIRNFSHKDILAIVAFSRPQDYFAIDSGHGSSDDFTHNPSLLNIVASISCKAYQKVIFILFTEQTQPPVPKLYFSVSEASGRSSWDDIDDNSSYQLTIPLRPSKSQKESDILSVCQPQRFCFQKFLSTCKTFYVPLRTQQLYTHLKARVFKLRPGHKFPSPDDVLNNEKWIAADTLAKIVLRGQKSFYEDARSEFPGTCVTIDAVSLCNPKDSDMKSQYGLSSDEDIRIHPPRDLLTKSQCFDFNTECDSFSNFSEMKRDLFS